MLDLEVVLAMPERLERASPLAPVGDLYGILIQEPYEDLAVLAVA
jgi:hypothetical protein